MLLGAFVVGLLSLTALAAYPQQPLQPQDPGSCAPADGLPPQPANPGDEYTILDHPAFPNYGVRVRQSDWCDGAVTSYSGYIDIETRHLFFYFFESRNDPAKDDVVMWIAGGPGCSTGQALLFELGPCLVDDVYNSTFNPYSWTAHANMIFIDQPAGVGFSYDDYGSVAGTTEAAAKDVAAFVMMFFEHFSQYKGRAFHLAGSSYAGTYVPVFAAEIFDRNTKLVESGMTPINLSSIMVGNACTDALKMTLSFYDMQCKHMSVPPISNIHTCVRMAQAVPRCEALVKTSCLDTYDAVNCKAAHAFCSNELNDPFYETGYNPYDISQLCDGTVSTTQCYPVIQRFSSYLDRPDVRAGLGVDPAITQNYSLCSASVSDGFHAHGDWYLSSTHYTAALLEHGLRTLLYAGANDWMCNWVGNERTWLAMEWTGQEAFREAPRTEWTVDGTVAGHKRSSGLLTFLTVDRAGHMVGHDQPEAMLEMMRRWLAHEDI